MSKQAQDGSEHVKDRKRRLLAIDRVRFDGMPGSVWDAFMECKRDFVASGSTKQEAANLAFDNFTHAGVVKQIAEREKRPLAEVDVELRELNTRLMRHEGTPEGKAAATEKAKGGSKPWRPDEFRRSVQWVYDNLGLDADAVDLDKAPSAGAITMLETYRGGNKREFYQTFGVRLLPSKAQLDAEVKGDDGSPADRTIEAILAENDAVPAPGS